MRRLTASHARLLLDRAGVPAQMFLHRRDYVIQVPGALLRTWQDVLRALIDPQTPSDP